MLLLFYAVLPLLIGLLLAGLMARARVRGLAFFRTILFLPQVIALVVVAVMWKMIYDPDNGALNRFLGWFGIEGKSWLGDFSLALPSVGFVGTWLYFGLAMVLLTAGVQKIPASLYDAARVDGAGAFREFLAVTLPGLRGEIAVVPDADDDLRAAQLRPRLHHDPRRARGRDDRARVPGVLARVRERAGGLRRGGRDHADRDHLPDLAGDQPARGARHVTSRTEQTLAYVVLGAFSLIALLPIVGIVFTALQDPDEIAPVRLLRRVALRELHDGVGGRELRRRI